MLLDMRIYVEHDDMLDYDDTSKLIDYVTIAKFDTVGFLPLQALVDTVEVYTGATCIEQYLKQPNVPRFHKVSKRMYNLVSYAIANYDLLVYRQTFLGS